MAYTQFTDEPTEPSRMKPSGNRTRLVDCMEEFVKYTIIMRPHFALFGDRHSERQTRAENEAKELLVAATNIEEDGKVNGISVQNI